jgi:putative cell wall-binding protein
VIVSKASFPTAGSAGAVVLARDDTFPDALTGTPLAVKKNAPLLLTHPDSLMAETQAEIQRVLTAGKTVYILGGNVAINPSVELAIQSLGYNTVRLAGPDRFRTAIAIAGALSDPNIVLLATGTAFPDALTAGSAAAHVNGIVLLTEGSTQNPDTQNYLNAHPGDTVSAVGGPASLAAPSATPVVGSDRYETSTKVATAFFTTGPTAVGIATGTVFPDSLTGGAGLNEQASGPILLTDPATLPAVVTSYLTAHKSTITLAIIFGGPVAVTPAVMTAVQTALT